MKYALLILSLLALPVAAFAQEYGFVPLTNVPFLTDTGNSFDLSQFLNNLYRLAIGVAAVLAVLQIMRAGIMYMGGDSVTEKKEAKNLIGLSIAGLVLVLSPVVVFSIINPEILSLKINKIEDLNVNPEDVTTGSGSVCTPACTGGNVCVSGACVTPNGVGDGTCSTDCVSGRECRQGQCVPMDTSSCTPLTNGQRITTPAAENCCAAQQGCAVTVRNDPGSDLGISSFCSCSTTEDEEDADPTPTPGSNLIYGYRIFVERTSGGSPFMYTSQNRFPTADACSADMQATLNRNGYTVSGQSTSARQCNCFTPLSQQPGC